MRWRGRKALLLLGSNENPPQGGFFYEARVFFACTPVAKRVITMTSRPEIQHDPKVGSGRVKERQAGCRAREARIVRTRVLWLALLLSLLPAGLSAEGIRTWYGNEVFMRGLDTSIRAFFGDSVGIYLRSDDFAFTLAPMNATSPDERMLIANQFLAVFGRGAPGMSRLANGKILHDYSAFQDGERRVGVVTLDKSTTILAAAITHWSCGTIAASEVHDAATVRANYESATCERPSVTIFFKDHASVNPVIRKELVKWGTRPLVELCEGDRRMGLLDYPAGSPQREQYAKHLHSGYRLAAFTTMS
jgi:hypothetical protein